MKNENSIEIEQKEMENKKENIMRKSEDWSRRSIILIRGVWERKRRQKMERNNQQPYFRKSLRFKRCFQTERAPILSTMAGKRPNTRIHHCKNSEHWKDTIVKAFRDLKNERGEKRGRKKGKQEKKRKNKI